LYKHCPFSKEIRQTLLSHPSFTKLATQYENNRALQVKNHENRYAKYALDGITIDKEMIDTLEFFKNF
jgi:hypothetical protein